MCLPQFEAGVEGIGLFRTEFLYLGRSAPPTEDEQTAIYAEVLSAMERSSRRDPDP